MVKITPCQKEITFETLSEQPFFLKSCCCTEAAIALYVYGGHNTGDGLMGWSLGLAFSFCYIFVDWWHCAFAHALSFISTFDLTVQMYCNLLVSYS